MASTDKPGPSDGDPVRPDSPAIGDERGGSPDRPGRDDMVDTRRLEAFSDGVLAVAITLLVLGVTDPRTPHTTLAHRLVHLWPAYAAYAVSFLVIGIIWVNHHDTFKQMKHADRTMQFINLILLMTVVAIPFPTSLLAAHLTGGGDSHAAAFTYGLVMTLMGIAFTALWVHAARTPAILADHYDASYAWRRARRSGYGPLIYATGALLGLISAPASLGLFAVVAVYFAVGQRDQL